MTQREAQMGDAGLEVVGEALDDRGELAAGGRYEVVAEQGGQRGRGGFVTGPGPDGDLRPLAVRRFAVEIAQAVDQAALAQRARKSGLHGPDEPRRAIGDGQQRIGQAAALEILEEGRAAGGVLLRPGRQVQQHLPALLGDAPAHSTASRGSPTCSRSATPSTKK